ncbi:hypothetical protein BDQ12DRAFT_686767 [Crucibulum laeve]|uniref:Uncharacterized protein n=1 Tax=Crucibulum laeve TaxID=68775 RepID=A0A5C3LT73_9AGAR|nr:hypothetical protein BDQ12DRAFT_686767 [Crucibulum laeve]
MMKTLRDIDEHVKKHTSKTLAQQHHSSRFQSMIFINDRKADLTRILRTMEKKVEINSNSSGFQLYTGPSTHLRSGCDLFASVTPWSNEDESQHITTSVSNHINPNTQGQLHQLQRPSCGSVTPWTSRLLNLCLTIYFLPMFHIPAYYSTRATHFMDSVDIWNMDSNVHVYASESEYAGSLENLEGNDTPASTDSIVSRQRWKIFTATIVEEWKSIRVLSTMVLGAVLAMFQIPSVNQDPVIRSAAYFSLICVMTSTFHSTVEIIHFSSWDDERVVENWLQEIQGYDFFSLWNTWILLSIPAVWAIWGGLSFIISVILLLWRSSPISSPSIDVSSQYAPLGIRLVLSTIMLMSIVHILLIYFTLRRIRNIIKDPHLA